MSWKLFDKVPPDQTRALLAQTRRCGFARGEVVFHEGDPGDTLHLLESGHAAVGMTTATGDTATLRIISPGEYFGELAVISPAPRHATITALEPTVTLALHRDRLSQLRREHPEVDAALLDAVVCEVRRLSTALLEARYVPTSIRLLRQLIALASTYPTDRSGRIVIPLTQDDLAGLCGTTRPTVNQLLGKLADKELLEVTRGRVTVLDLSGLAGRAG